MSKKLLIKKWLLAIILFIADALGIMQLIITITMYTDSISIWLLIICYTLAAILIILPMIGMYELGAMIAYMEFDEILDDMLQDMENKNARKI